MLLRFLLVFALLSCGCSKGNIDRDGDGFIDCELAERAWPRWEVPSECFDNRDIEQDTSLGAEQVNRFNPEVHDCSDSDPDVHPGAIEICDGFDNDCNGSRDEWSGEDGAWPPELDCDGDGFVKIFGGGEMSDCAPWDAAVYPGAPELDDGRDNDCNNCPDDFMDDDPSSCPESDPSHDSNVASGCDCDTSSLNAAWIPLGILLMFTRRRIMMS